MNRSPKILIFKYSLVIGGGERHNLILSKELKKRGWDVVVFSNFKPFIKRLRKKGVKTKNLFWGNEASSKRNVIKFFIFYSINYIKLFTILVFNFRRGRMNVVLFQNLNEKIIATKMAKSIGYKVFWLEHLSVDPWLSKSILKNKYRVASGFVDRIVTVSSTVESELLREIKIDRNKIITINNGIDLDIFCPEDESKIEAKKKELGLYKGSKIIGYAGRLHNEKGVETLLIAFSFVLKRFDSVYLVIVGDGPDRHHLENLSRKLGIDKKVFFLGFRDDVSIILNILDIFVLPSLVRETCSLSILEAFAMGKVVIASDTGGNPDLVSDGKNGFLFRAGDAKDLSEKISRLLSDHELKIKMQENSAKIVRERFSKEVMVNNFEELFLS